MNGPPTTINPASVVVRKEHIPNLITSFRFLLIPPIVGLMLADRYAWALVLLLIAGLSDGLDGFLAKHYGWCTRLGAFLDPLADKTLVTATYLTLGWQQLIPGWLVVVVILRDVMILSGAVVYQALTQRLQMSPIWSSKFNTVAQIMLVLVVMWFQAIGSIWTGLINTLIGLVLLTTALSGGQYVVAWTRKAIQARRYDPD